MISVVIPTFNSEEGLARTLSSLVPAAAEGVVREVVVVDGGSRDGTTRVADAAGCVVVDGQGVWGERVAAGVSAMRRAPWVLVLPPHIDLDATWHREVSLFIERVDRSNRTLSDAACFRLEFDSFGWRARCAERIISVWGSLFGLPTVDQGILLTRDLWDRIAGRGIPDSYAKLVQRIGRSQIHVLRATGVVLDVEGDACEVMGPRRMLRYLLAGVGVPGVGFKG